MRILAGVFEGIGNNIVMSPAIAALGSLFPYVRIDLITKYPGLWHGMPFVKPVRGQKFAENFYDIMVTNIFDYPQYYAGITIQDKWPTPVLNYYESHEIAQNLQPIIDKGFDGDWPLQFVPNLPVQTLFKTDRPVVGICDGSKPRSTCQTDEEYMVWQKKRWPHFPEFCENLLAEGAYVAVFGMAEDGAPEMDHPNLIDLRGEFRIEQLPNALRQCDVFVSNDCGPMHVGDAAGVRTYALFGPTSVVKNAPVCITSTVIDAREMFNSEEPRQGEREFGITTTSPALQQLTPEMVREIIGDLR